MARDLTQGSVLNQMIRFALPLMAANLLQIVYTLVDMIVVGRFVGSAGISAVAVGGDIMGLYTTFSMGLCGAGQVMISQYSGRGDRSGVSRTIGTMFSFISIFSLCLMVAGLLLSDWLLGILNTPPEALSMAKAYTVTCSIGMFFIFGYNSVSAMLRGMGDSKRPLMFISIATVSNMILDVLFVGVFKLAAFGAALATVIGQAISFVASLFYLFKQRQSFGFDFRPASFRIDGTLLGTLIKLGIPMALNSFAISVSNIYIGSLVNSYGLVVSAVSGIGAKVRVITAIFANSISTATSTMIGQAMGKGMYDRIRKTFLCCCLVLAILCGSLGVIGAVFPKTIFRMFDTNPEVLAMAPKYMFINLFTCFAFATMMPGFALINGIGYAKMSLFVGIMDGFVAKIGLVWLFHNALDLGIWGVWWAATLAAYVSSILTMGYFISGRWRNRTAVVK